MSDQFAPPPPPDTPGAPPPPPPPPDGGIPGAPSGGGGHGQDPGQPTGPQPPGQQPPYQPAYQAQQAQPPSGGGGKKTLLIVIVAVILLCCCTTIGVGYWLFQSGNIGDIGRAVSGDAPPPATSSDEGMVGEAGTVAVWLSWNEPVDMDLEIWDASGEEFLTAAYAYSGNDLTTGGQGEEYFEFTSYAGQDFSSGEYVVSAYYVGSDTGNNPDANVTMTVQDVNGSVQSFTKTIKWDPGYDQWHAGRIDAGTGTFTQLDEWY